ncbi:MAG: lipopolysaccharide biosynthesis protein RfbH [Candidatus Methylacidiphilales bacterium]|nr:lipopolysaccharide biosynthesis protein RfbH [Candidatus Methylacidiphilales bacterium]
MIQPGRFYYLDWPHTDSDRKGSASFSSKSRPALAITGADKQGDVTLLKVTGAPHYPHAIAFTQEDLASGRLLKTSYIRTDRFLTVHESELRDWGASLKPSRLKDCHKALALSNSRSFSRLTHLAQRPGDDEVRLETEAETHRKLEAGNLKPEAIPYAGRVFDEDEVTAAVSATLDFWLTLGKEGEAFESELAEFLGVRRCILTNSGSSANLLAFTALTSHKLPPEKRIRPSDEIITCAAGFPTTVAPILQNGAVPVFLDNDPTTGNADLSRLEEAFVPGKTKAVMMAHALGNPFDLATVLAFCKKHDLWLIEDNCDALGCTYSLPVALAESLGLQHLLQRARANPESNTQNQALKIPRIVDGILTAYTGTFGDLSTQSFYPPHHLTMGEGGAINIVKDMKLKVLVESFRDWGRDCWCASGVDNTCRKRFGWQLGELPEGYDHKYIYSHIGYNLKPLDPQAAIGRAQLKKMPAFIEARKRNWELLRRGLAGLEDVLEFALPTHASAWLGVEVEGLSSRKDEWQEASFGWKSDGLSPLNSDMSHEHGLRCSPSWFGFMMLVKPGAPFSRTDLARHLDEHKIGNRMLFGGNLVRQPAFVQLRHDNPDAFRVVGGSRGKQGATSLLPGADRIMNEAIFIGVYPGLTPAQIDRMVRVIRGFVGTERQVSG